MGNKKNNFWIWERVFFFVSEVDKSEAPDATFPGGGRVEERERGGERTNQPCKNSIEWTTKKKGEEKENFRTRHVRLKEKHFLRINSIY